MITSAVPQHFFSPLTLSLPQEAQITLPPHTILYKQGEPVTHLFFILSGIVKLTHTPSSGNARLVHLAGAGDALGFGDLVTGSHQYTATIAEPLQAYRISKETLLHPAKLSPSTRYSLFFQLERQFSSLEQQLKYLFIAPAPKRIAQILRMLYLRFGMDPEGFLRPPLTRDELAQLCRISRRTLFRVLHQWEEAGWVLRKGSRLRILNWTALLQQ